MNIWRTNQCLAGLKKVGVGWELSQGSLRDPADGSLLNLDCGGYLSVQVIQLFGTKYRHTKSSCGTGEV